MNAKYQALFWVVLLLVIMLFTYLFRSVLTPFVAGIVVAYLLNPIVEKLESLKVSRLLATVAILSLFFIAALTLLILIIPPLYRELVELADNVPAYIDTLWARLGPAISSFGGESNLQNLDQGLKEIIRENFSNALNVSANVVAALIGGGRAFANFLSVVFITPLVAFFMMVEWQTIVNWVDDLLPRSHQKQIRKLVAEIDSKISGFIRGQLMVAITLGVIYALALSLAGLEYGFLIGLVSGVLTIIPMFGSIVGLVVGAIVAWFQTGEIVFTGIIVAIFLAGQLIESNYITPKFLSGSVGLHPLWILFSLLAGSALFGIVGMMIAVPVAATIGVLLSFALENYKSSAYYTD